MYKNLFAACLVISIGFHIILAVFIISHKPVSENIPVVSVQQVSLVGNIKSGLKSIVIAETNKPIRDIPSPMLEKISSGLEKIRPGTNSSDMSRPLDAKTENSSAGSGLGNASKPVNEEKEEKGSPASGLSGTETVRGNGGDNHVPVSRTLNGAQYGITKAHLINQPDIRYDEMSRRRGEEGNVGVALEIDRSGNPRKVRLTESSGYPRLDRVALNGIRSSRFSPTMKSGRPVESEVEYTIIFRLKDEKSGMMIEEDRNVRILE